MDLSTEQTPTAAQPTWILYRGMRLEQGGFYYRVDVKPVPGKPDRCLVDVMAVPKAEMFALTHETISKPNELAFRIPTAALQGGTK